ncbi:MAG: hypothetical protein AAGE52_03845 [Myxococcota bacterium]
MTRFAFVLLVACGHASAPPTTPPAPPPQETPPPVAPRLDVQSERATWNDAPLPWPTATLGAAWVPREVGDDVEIEVQIRDGVLATLASGTRTAGEIREAFFARGPIRDVEVGPRRLKLAGTDLDLHAFGELPAGETWIVIGAELFRRPGILVLPQLEGFEEVLAGVLYAPGLPPWLQDALGAYLRSRDALRGSEEGARWVLEAYAAHRDALGTSLSEGDQSGAQLALFCLDLKGAVTGESLRELEGRGDFRGVLDLDDCLRAVDARLVARVIPRYTDVSIRRFFHGALVEGEPPTVVRSPGPLRMGDVITHLRGEPFARLHDLGQLIGTLEPRRRLTVAVRRDGRRVRLWLTVPTMEVESQEVRFSVEPDPARHPAWPFAPQTFDTEGEAPPN